MDNIAFILAFSVISSFGINFQIANTDPGLFSNTEIQNVEILDTNKVIIIKDFIDRPDARINSAIIIDANTGKEIKTEIVPFSYLGESKIVSGGESIKTSKLAFYVNKVDVVKKLYIIVKYEKLYIGVDGFHYEKSKPIPLDLQFRVSITSNLSDSKFLMVPIFYYEKDPNKYQSVLTQIINDENSHASISFKEFISGTTNQEIELSDRTNYVILCGNRNTTIKVETLDMMKPAMVQNVPFNF